MTTEWIDTTVITPTMTGREAMLAEARDSVTAQTVKPTGGHQVWLSQPPPELGPNPGSLAAARNEMLLAVTTPWVSCLDDDDTYLPDHFAKVSEHLLDADVLYSWPTERSIYVVDVTGWSTSLIAEQLRSHNFIPSNATIRCEALRHVGGWSEEWDPITRRFQTGCTWEDWDLWLRLATEGARFVCVPAMTWVYRMHDEQSSRRWNE